MRPRVTDQSGFTLTELLIATTIMMAVVAGLFSVLNPAQGTFRAQPEVADMQQRMRVAVDSLHKDLIMAGAGTYSGPIAGALLNYFSPITPYRLGVTNPDPPGSFRSDTVTLLFVPETPAQTTISQAMPRTSNEIKVNSAPGCPPGDPLCGFGIGMTVLIYDDTGAWNTFVITEVQTPALHIQRHGPDFQKDYAIGAHVAQAFMRTYYLKMDDLTQTYQLMYYDGGTTDVPLVDNVVGLRFEYFGDPRPPVLKKPLSDPVGPWTTYGPKPPALGVNNGMGYANGENCTFQVVSGQQVSRLADLAPGSGALVNLTQDMLTDGPWCPGPASQGRFDADLLRVRRVRVTLRVQASSQMLRGTGALFAKGGFARGGEMWVPDQEVRFDVTPRNLNLGR